MSSEPRVLVGVLTSIKSFETRVRAIHQTWADPKHLPNSSQIKILFFIGQDAEKDIFAAARRIHVPLESIVSLPGVTDDVYPPVIKSTHMITYMCNMLSFSDYNWIMKVDDDTLVRVKGLIELLNPFNPLEQHIYLGQRGKGKPKDAGKMGLIKSYCLGGPGYVFSRASAMLLGPSLIKCAHNIREKHDKGWHEDVVVGRCTYKHVHGMGCWDTRLNAQRLYSRDHIFFEKYPFLHWPTKENIYSIVSMHPLKNPNDMVATYHRLVAINTSQVNS